MTVRTMDALPRTATPLQVIDAVNRHNNGKVNVMVEGFTLTANATLTTLTDSRVSPQSGVFLMPTTANAAAALATTYKSDQANGSISFTHVNNAQTDRTFNVLIIG